jgi:hypothetical protein
MPVPCQDSVKKNSVNLSEKDRDSLRLIFRLEVFHPVPSLNWLFQAGPFKRHKERRKIQNAFASALRAIDAGSSTQTTFVPSISLTVSDMLERFQMTRRRSWNSSSRKPKLPALK